MVWINHLIEAEMQLEDCYMLYVIAKNRALQCVLGGSILRSVTTLLTCVNR